MKKIQGCEPTNSGKYRVNYNGKVNIATIVKSVGTDFLMRIKNAQKEIREVNSSQMTFFNHFKKQ